MKSFLFLILFSTASAFAQSALLPGIILPVALDSVLNSKKLKVSQQLETTLMQDVALPDGPVLRAGAKIRGHVTAVAPPAAGRGAQVTLQFDTLEFSDRRLPIMTSLRAVASMMEVHYAQLPKGTGVGTPASLWITTQVGGDVVNRGRGIVANSGGIVGKPAANGVLVKVLPNPKAGCPNAGEGDFQLQSLWLFSADACGAYGVRGLTIAHAGATAPIGQITLAASKDQFNVKSGGALLLQVVGDRP